MNKDNNFLPSNRNKIIGVIYRQLVLYRRHLDRKFDTFFWPIVDAILFGAIGTYAQRNGSSSTVVIILSGFVMAQVVWQSHIHISKFFIQEMWDNNVLYVMTRPLRSTDMLLGAIVLTATISSTAIVFIALCVSLVFGLSVGSIPFAIVALIPILMLMGWSTGLLATSLVVRMGQKADNFVWAMFGLIGPLSGSIVPVENLPIGLRHIAEVLPMTHAYQAGRQILFGHGFPALELGLAAGGALLLYGVGLFTISRNMEVFRKRGYISRYV